MIAEDHLIRKDMRQELLFQEWFRENMPMIMKRIIKARKSKTGYPKPEEAKTDEDFRHEMVMVIKSIAREIWIEIYAEAFLVGEAIVEEMLLKSSTKQ